MAGNAHHRSSRFRRHPLTGLLAALALVAALAIGGCGWMGGDSDDDGNGGGAPTSAARAVVVSGTVRNVSGEGAARLARAELPAVGGALVEVHADLNGDGTYGVGELFGTTADGAGFFALALPTAAPVSRVTLRVSKPGYSQFVREYEGVEGALMVAPSLSEGEFTAIDLSGVAAGPTRAGRVALDTDEVVTLTLVADRATGRRSARVARGTGAAEGDAGRDELLRVAFPLRGLDLPAGSEEIFANVAYLDTVNDTEVMPGGFQAEGEGETPVDLLATYGASQIQLFDADGRELMTDPSDRSNTIQIKMAIPPEAYETLIDEDDATDEVEIPLYYYDEAAGTWKLHKQPDGSPAYGVLEDNFGNRLTRSDLADLQQVRVDDLGERVPDSQYAPEGALPADVTVYGVGTVHHFTTWNCDRAGRSSSMHFKVKGKKGKGADVDARYRKSRGGRSSDHGRPKNGRTNLHADYDGKADSLIKKLLNRTITGEERARLLWTLQHGENREAKQALIEAIRRYAEDLRDEIAGEGDDLARGIRAIFNNKTINDAFINTDGLDCTRTPDLCNGVLAMAAETVNNSKDAQKVVAFLMQIAVDAYNPSNMDYDYVLDKGVAFLDVVTSMDGAAAELKGIPEKVQRAKSLVATVKNLRNIAKGDWSNMANFTAYREAADELKDVMTDIKDTASALGSRMGRVVARTQAAPVPDPANAEEAERLAQWIEDATVYAYEDVGGLLLGASRFSRYPFAYYAGEELCLYLPNATGALAEVCTPDDATVAELRDAARAGSEALHAAADRVGARVVREEASLDQQQLPGGGEVGMLEYFDGTEWVPLPGESDLGIDPNFIPVPRETSFGEGTRERPMMYLGTWTLEAEPNVAVTGRVLTDTGSPARSAVIYVGGEELRPDAEGRLSGNVVAIADRLEYRVVGARGGFVNVVDGVADLGDLTLPEAVLWEPGLPGTYTLERNQTVEVPHTASSLSGDPVSYTARLYRNYAYQYSAGVAPEDEVSGSESTYVFDSGVFDGLGYYYLDVTAATASGVSATRVVRIMVVNAPPVLDDVIVAPAAPRVGDEIRVSLIASDPDGAEDLASRGLRVWCEDGAGATAYLWPVQDGDAWVLRTEQMRELYRWDVDSWTCQASAWVSDRSYGSARRQQSFPLLQNQVAPEVRWKYLADSYSQGYAMTVVPVAAVHFEDRNGDLERYEVDCGNGQTYRSEEPVFETCTYAQAGEYPFAYRAIDRGGRSTEVRSTIHYLYPLRMAVGAPAGLTPVQQGEGLATVYELPTTGAAGLTLDVTAVSDNGPAGFAEGLGTIDQLYYTLRYQSGTSWWPEYLAYYEPGEGGTVPVVVDKPGTYTLVLEARDTQGIYARFPFTFQVTAPFDGQITLDGKSVREFRSSSRPWVMTDQPVAFDVTATGPEGWAPQYVWTANDSVLSNQKNPTVTFTQAGDYRVKVVLRNGADTVDRQVVREVIFPVYAPLTAAFGSTYEPLVEGEVRAGDAYTVSLAFPPEQNVTSVQWAVSVQGEDGSYAPSTSHQVTGTESLTSRTFLFPQTGSYQVTATLKDDRGVKTTVAWDQPIVVAVHAPEISALGSTRSFGRPPFAATFTATAADPDARVGEALTYRWFVDGAEIAGATGATFTHTFSQEGTHSVKARVTDAGGLSAERSVSVVAAYTPPTIAEIQADAGSGPAPLAVTFTAAASDSDGTVVHYAWDATNDGTWDQEGPSATFAHTYDPFGTYTVRLRVTDNDGKTAEKTRQVFALDPAASSVVFEFKELRSDGFGPAYDFTQAGPQGSDGAQQLAHAPLSDVNLQPENLVDLASVLEFTEIGFYGPYGMSWGQPSTVLFQVAEAGTYTVGMRNWGAVDAVRTVQFPGTYSCGLLAYQGWADTFGTYLPESLSSRTIQPDSAGITAAGEAKVLAFLGSVPVSGDPPYRCVPEYYGYATGAGPTLTLDGTTAITALPLVPAGADADQYAFDAVTVDVGDGIAFTLYSGDLEVDGAGRTLIPVVPGATYALRFLRNVGGRSWEFKAQLAADAILAQSQANVDFSAVVDRTDLAVANTVAGDSLGLGWESPWGRISGSIYTDGGSGPVGTVPSLAGAGATVALSYSGGGANAGFHREGAVADLTPTLDLASPGVSVTLAAPSLAVDTTAQTVALDIGAVTGDLCIVAVNGTYNDPALTTYAYRNGRWTFVTDGTVTSYTFAYPIPESTFSYMEGGTAEVIPGTSALTEVQVEVSCGISDLGYGGLLPELLKDLDVYGLSGSLLVEKGLVSEGITRKTSWTAP